MHHYFEAITNTSGDSLIGYFARVVDPATNNGVTIAADNNGTPISTVSGVDNAAKTDAYGNLDFYVQPGTYHLDIYAPNATSLQLRVQNVAMNSAKGDTGATGAQGDPGPADSTFTTISALQAAPATNKSYTLADLNNGRNDFSFVSGNFTGQADNVDIFQQTGTPLTSGALVRKMTDTIAYREKGPSLPIPLGQSRVITADTGTHYILGAMDDATFLSSNPDWGFLDKQGRPWRTWERKTRPDQFRRTTDTTGDDTAMFERFRDGMIAQSEIWAGTENALKFSLELTRQYTVKKPGAIMAQGQVNKRLGYTIRGVNRLCGINYDPATAGPLMFNDDSFLFIDFDGFFIRGIGKADQSSLWQSRTIANAPQNYCFSKLLLNGRWGAELFLLRPDSNNNNSEARWTNCEFSCDTQTTTLRSQGSDQHLNYGMFACTQQGGGPLADMQMGGHLAIENFDASGVAFTTADHMVKVGTDPNVGHALGVCVLKIKRFRLEQKNANTKFLAVRWPYGTVDVEQYDGSSQTFAVADIPDNIVWETGNAPGANVTVEKSLIPGKGRFTGGSGFGQDTRAFFEDNTFLQATTPDAYATVTADFPGAKPNVVFGERNRGSGTNNQPTTGISAHWGCNAGWLSTSAPQGARGTRKRYFVPLLDANGGNGTPGGVYKAYIPLGAIIDQTVAFLPPGFGSGGQRSVTFTCSDGTALPSPAAFVENAGIDYTSTTGRVWCNTDAKRLIVATVGGNTDRSVPLCTGIWYWA